MELCERLASLEIDAWDSLYVEHRRLIRGVLASHLGYSAELEDVTQQVFETALDLVESGKTRLTGTPSGMRAWLVAIAVRLARSERRRSHKAARHESMPDESITSQSTEPEVWQLLTRTQALVAQLPERLRIPWLLRHLEGMRLEEIATCCGISLASTKRRLLRAERRFGALAEHDAVLREHLAERSTP
jgi:RNA polymerase sigma-70 factor (ECF subfamily)